MKNINNIIQNIYKKLQAYLIFLGFIFLIIICAGAVFFFYFFGKIYPGVYVNTINLSSKTPQQALILLKNKIKQQPQKIILSWQGTDWTISLSEVDFSYLPEQTIQTAYNVGRKKDFKTSFLEITNALKNNHIIPVKSSLNRNILKTKIKNISSQVDIPYIPPTIKIVQNHNSSQIEIEPGRQGKKVNQTQIQKEIENNLTQLTNLKFTLPVENSSPFISQQKLEATKQRAENLLGKKIILQHKQENWQLTENELVNFLSLYKDYEQEKIASYTSQLALGVNRSPQNALFKFLPSSEKSSTGKVIEFKPAENGFILNQQQTNNKIIQALTQLEEKKDKKEIVVNLPVKETEPEVTTEAANDLGIKQLIGKGESWFYGSIASRIHNVQLASSRFNGQLIPPNTTFSFNKALGEVSAKTGFQQAYIIKDGRTVLGDGGGVCQVSTTLFRAALDAGLPIEERHAHSYRVSYYEYNSQVGLDATVFNPTEDLMFQNDTPAHILIQTQFEPAKMKLTFNLYGTDDGRIVTISDSRIWDQTAPPPDHYQDDPTLPQGTVKQIDWKAWGAKTAFDWKVVKGTETLQERTFFSSYKPWQAIFLRGTGP